MNDLATAVIKRAYIDEATKRAMLAEHAASSSGVARFNITELAADDASARAIELVPGIKDRVVLPFMVVCSCEGLLPADLELNFGWGADKDFVSWKAAKVALGGEAKGSIAVITSLTPMYKREHLLGLPFSVSASAALVASYKKEKERVEKEFDKAEKKHDDDKIVQLLEAAPEPPDLQIVTMFSTL